MRARTFRPPMRALLGFALLGSLATGAPALAAPAGPIHGAPLEVRILIDNSGSMYPGYRVTPPTRKSELGSRFYYQYGEFREWLADFVAAQEVLGAGSVAMAAFTDNDRSFHATDVGEIHPRVPLAEFDPQRIVPALEGRSYGQFTYLSEALDSYSRGFNGLIWLITDNIVEKDKGTPDALVDAFFRALKENRRYQSVHLFGLHFEDPSNHQHSELAVYGIRVADGPLEKQELASLDVTMRSRMAAARRRQGSSPAELFPGRRHLKLKDLSIDALELTTPPQIQVRLHKGDEIADEDQEVSLELQGEVHSYLTQHSVTHGDFTLIPLTAFVPESWAVRDFGVQPISPQSFSVVSVPLSTTIPPGGVQPIRQTIPSRGKLHIETRGLGSWLTAAFKGAVIEYTGTAQVSFSNIQVRLDRSRMEGIFGADKASAIFDIQDVRTIQVAPTIASIHLSLRTSPRRTALLALLAALLGLPLAALAFFASRKEHYRVRVGEQNTVVALRRLGGYDVRFRSHLLGRLSRGLGNHSFAPQPPSAAVTVTPSPGGNAFEVRLRDEGSHMLTIERVGDASPGGGGAARRAGRANPTGAVSIRPPGPPGPASAPPPPGGPVAGGGGPSAPARPRPTIRRP